MKTQRALIPGNGCLYEGGEKSTCSWVLLPPAQTPTDSFHRQADVDMDTDTDIDTVGENKQIQRPPNLLIESDQ